MTTTARAHAVIGPLLQATPDLTHAEALEAVRAAGVAALEFDAACELIDCMEAVNG